MQVVIIEGRRLRVEQLVVKMVERPLQMNSLMVWSNFHLLFTVHIV